MLVARLRGGRRVALGRDFVLVPSGTLGRFGGSEARIRFADIRSLELRDVARSRFFTITHTGGQVVIMQSWLPSDEDFRQVVAAVVEGRKSASQPAPLKLSS